MTRSWRVAPAVSALFTQANLQAPKRMKAHDGTIGDTRHQASKSDHNPTADGWVYAGDLTDDDASGIDCREIAWQIVARRDRRVKYLIHEGRICSGNNGPRPWEWRPYSGSNSHHKHLHVSVLERWRNDTSPWWVPPATPGEDDDDMTNEQDDRLKAIEGNVREIAAFLNKIAAKVGVSGPGSRLEILSPTDINSKVEK